MTHAYNTVLIIATLISSCNVDAAEATEKLLLSEGSPAQTSSTTKRALGILLSAVDELREAKTFSVDVYKWRSEVELFSGQDRSPITFNQEPETYHVYARIPGQLSIRPAQGQKLSELVIDGGKWVVYSPFLGVYAKQRMPPKYSMLLDDTDLETAMIMEGLYDITVVVLAPLAENPRDFLSNEFSELTYEGTLFMDDIACHLISFKMLYSFRGTLLVTDEESPKVIQIRRKPTQIEFGDDGSPYVTFGQVEEPYIEFKSWDLGAELNDERFVFSPPVTAKEVNSLEDAGN